MIYHLEVTWGESPGLATVNVAPFESYVGLPWGVKESDGPSVKSMFTALPNAGFAGQLPAFNQYCEVVRVWGKEKIPLVRGLHVV